MHTNVYHVISYSKREEKKHCSERKLTNRWNSVVLLKGPGRNSDRLFGLFVFFLLGLEVEIGRHVLDISVRAEKALGR